MGTIKPQCKPGFGKTYIMDLVTGKIYKPETMKKQTALTWFLEQQTPITPEMLLKALEMERQQIADAFVKSAQDYEKSKDYEVISQIEYKAFKYIKETFGTDESL
jgi:hypothetical protein